MPNYVKNIIKIKNLKNAKEIDNVFKEIIDQKGYFDFNKVIPMPDYIFKGNLGKKEKEKYGENNWYDWSIKNWGTKWNNCGWNSYENIIEKGNTNIKIYFETAWSMPEPIFEELSRKFNKEIEVRYADEDFGNNCGKVRYIPTENGIYKEYITPKNPQNYARKLWNE